jgi:alkylated DNA repair dioxygenase AlkB
LSQLTEILEKYGIYQQLSGSAKVVTLANFHPVSLLDELDREIVWRQDRIKIFGRTNPLPRLTAYYGDPGTAYKYSGIVNEPEPWTPTLLTLRKSLRDALGADFNAVLVNRYADGSQHMGYHADDEPELGPSPLIASLSFGATRRFLVKSCDGRERFALDLEDRSLLIMAGSFQLDYRHALAKTKRQVGLRINLTFRQVLVPRAASA